MKTEEVAIIGAGPAGIATAIQLSRYRIPPVLIEKNQVGGLLWNANLVENYPGFPHGISGPRLVSLFERQLHAAGVNTIGDEMLCLDEKSGIFLLNTQRTQLAARIVVIAVGTKPKTIPLAIPDEARDRIFSEVYPLLGVKGKRIVIVGAGDAAFDYALNLARNNVVTILNRADAVKCIPVLWERVKCLPQITVRANVKILQITSVDKASPLIIECSCEQLAECLECDYLIFAIGREPQLGFFSESVQASTQDFVHSGKLYFAGDVQNGLFRQTAIAVGDGLRVAMRIYNSKIIEGVE